jgi:hypothetical protein
MTQGSSCFPRLIAEQQKPEHQNGLPNSCFPRTCTSIFPVDADLVSDSSGGFSLKKATHSVTSQVRATGKILQRPAFSCYGRKRS